MKNLPGTLRGAVWWWGVLAAACLALSAATITNFELSTNAERVGLVTLSIALGVLALLIGWGAWQLARGLLAGRGLLTTFGLIAGIPLLMRGPRLGVLAVGLLIGVLLLWLPPSMAYFKEQSRQARALRKAERRQARQARGR
ncbi:hypothetical protein ACQ3I4_10175 [Zafaria sp. Z1313]|uniref:hypothetical protein n=1 Tax=unclassified Zafaria TaxID=2828765 RepID=UPI003D302DF6